MLGLPSIDANISTRVSLGKGQASVTPEASLKISGSDFSCGDMTGDRECRWGLMILFDLEQQQQR